MRLSTASRFEQFGNVQIHELQRVIEVDSGYGRSTPSSTTISPEVLHDVESRMVIVILCMNEEFKTIDGVLSGIPHGCLVIFVSNSSRKCPDRYRVESQIVQNFCRDADRAAITVHQKDPDVAAAFKAAGAQELLGDDGLVRNGKGEAMVMGMALAAMTGRQYVGFVDADNYIPGSVHEYCKVYAAGLHLAESPDAMVRVSWASKPKERNGRIMFDRQGRSSRVVNEWLNNLLQQYSGFGTDVITTGNAGEHAMSMELGLKLQLASGFAVEPYEYIYLFENCGGLEEDDMDNSTSTNTAGPVVEIRQILTRNPHLHDNKGEDHVVHMRSQALHMLYHSRVTPQPTRQAIQRLLVSEGLLASGQEPPRERVYPAVGTFDLLALYDHLFEHAASFHQHRGPPIVDSWNLDAIDREAVERMSSESPTTRSTPSIGSS